MALELAAIRTALVDKIRATVARDVNVYPYPLQNPNLPSVTVTAGGSGGYIDYQVTSGTSPVCDVYFTVTVVATAADEVSPQIVVDDLLSAGTGQGSSLIDALIADRTLGAVVQNLHIGTASTPRTQVDDSGAFTVSASVDVRILTRR